MRKTGPSARICKAGRDLLKFLLSPLLIGKRLDHFLAAQHFFDAASQLALGLGLFLEHLVGAFGHEHRHK